MPRKLISYSDYQDTNKYFDYLFSILNREAELIIPTQQVYKEREKSTSSETNRSYLTNILIAFVVALLAGLIIFFITVTINLARDVGLIQGELKGIHNEVENNTDHIKDLRENQYQIK